MERWSGKVALVTGASAGIGAAIAEELVKKGLKVVGLARRSEKVEDLKKNLAGAPGQLFALKGDVSKPEEVDAAFKWIADKFGTIHVLINNAGIIRGGNITDAKFELFQDVVNVNLLGLTKCTQKALQLMKASGVDDGHIININSVAGHIVPPFPGLNIYSATKHAVTALTETIRQELRTNKTKIRVTSISPGGVATEIIQAAKDASAELQMGGDASAIISEWPMLQSKDIADSVLYVLSTPPHVQVHEIIIKPLGEQI